MDFNYVQDMYGKLSNDLFSSSFVINATLHILGIDVAHESTYAGMGDSLDGRDISPVQKSFPLDLPRYVRIKVFPMERNYIRYQSSSIETTIAGKYEPFDRWVSCLESDVAVRVNETYYDYISHVSIEGIRYKLKAIHRETFGIKPIIHAFLVKESNE